MLGWEPKYTLDGLVEEMVLSDIELVKNGKIFSNTNLDWLVDESKNTVDSGNTNGNGVHHGPGSKKTVDSGKTNGNGVHHGHNGLDRGDEGKALTNGTNGHSLSVAPCPS